MSTYKQPSETHAALESSFKITPCEDQTSTKTPLVGASPYKSKHPIRPYHMLVISQIVEATGLQTVSDPVTCDPVRWNTMELLEGAFSSFCHSGVHLSSSCLNLPRTFQSLSLTPPGSQNPPEMSRNESYSTRAGSDI